MKSKTILTIILLCLFALPAYAGLVRPTLQIYVNKESKIEKFTPIIGLLNVSTYPIPTNSFTKADVACESDFAFICEGLEDRDVANLERLYFKDFSIFDKIKIILNVFILLIPFAILVLIYRRIKSLLLRIILVLLSILVCLFVLIYLGYV